SFLAVFVGVANAQTTTPINADFINGYGLRNLESAVVIHASPTTPAAGETVRFTVESPIYDLARDTIAWSIDGQVVAEGEGLLTTETKIDARGTPIQVSVSAIDPVW